MDLTSSFVDVNNGSLYYECLGQGPPLIMLPAGHGTGVVFEPLASILATKFRVILYDRRYFFRSTKSSPSGSLRNQSILQTHVDDAAALISHVSPTSPVHLFTTSSGAPIALELLYSRPHLINRLVMHEASLFTLLPQMVHAQYRKDIVRVWSKGKTLGAILFNQLITHWVHRQEEWDRLKGTETYRRLASLPRDANFAWLANELPEVLEYDFEMERLRPFRERLVLVRGSQNSPDAAVGPVSRLSDRLGIPLEVVPGGHEGYVTHHRDFADFLIESLGEGEEGAKEQRAKL